MYTTRCAYIGELVVNGLVLQDGDPAYFKSGAEFTMDDNADPFKSLQSNLIGTVVFATEPGVGEQAQGRACVD